ncbi:unnamed protein product [Calicophoron daubneyi]|uniref:Uncharacterized protein n=1 Tax=Calicophoron daubneyi TaxID=300641 RepID=A0AAV2TD01_CALDB
MAAPTRTVRYPSCHVAAGLLMFSFAAYLVALQLFSTIHFRPNSTWKWPRDSLPTGYISAGVLILPSVASLVTGCKRSRQWLKANMILTSLGTGIVIVLGIYETSRYANDETDHLSVFVLGLSSVSGGVVCLIYLFIVCGEICCCATRPHGHPTEAIPQNTLSNPPAFVPTSPMNYVAVDTTHGPQMTGSVEYSLYPQLKPSAPPPPNYSPPPYSVVMNKSPE